MIETRNIVKCVTITLTDSSTNNLKNDDHFIASESVKILSKVEIVNDEDDLDVGEDFEEDQADDGVFYESLLTSAGKESLV